MQQWKSVPWQQHHPSQGWMHAHCQEWHQQCKAHVNQFRQCTTRPTNYRAHPTRTKYGLLLGSAFNQTIKINMSVLPSKMKYTYLMPLQPLVSCWHRTLGPMDTTSANMTNAKQAFLFWDPPHGKSGSQIGAQAMKNTSPSSPFENYLHNWDKKTHSRTSPHLWWAWAKHQMVARFWSSRRRVSTYSRKKMSS